MPAVRHIAAIVCKYENKRVLQNMPRKLENKFYLEMMRYIGVFVELRVGM
jgi:hypothetical protein